MKLRSGFQTLPLPSSSNKKKDRLYCCPKALLRQIYLLDDINTHHYCDWFLSKVQETRERLNYIHEYSNEKLTSMDVTWLRNIYFYCVTIICKIIKASYKIKKILKKTKKELIRIVFAANQLQQKIGNIIWSLRTDISILKVIDSDSDEDAENMYRCLRHIISDEFIAYDYKIHMYENSDYAVELWDYYFAPNTMKCIDDDPFVKQATFCREAPICFWNIRTFM
jgi:hypothetical protein